MLDADDPIRKDAIKVGTVATAKPPMEIAALPAVLPAVLWAQDVQQILPDTARHACRQCVEKDCLLVRPVMGIDTNQSNIHISRSILVKKLLKLVSR